MGGRGGVEEGRRDGCGCWELVGGKGKGVYCIWVWRRLACEASAATGRGLSGDAWREAVGQLGGIRFIIIDG